jgi:hypothetical protein
VAEVVAFGIVVVKDLVDLVVVVAVLMAVLRGIEPVFVAAMEYKAKDFQAVQDVDSIVKAITLI